MPLALSALLTACGGEDGAVGSQTKVTDSKGYVAEYQAEKAKWSLPSGAAYPAGPRGDLSGQWEVGSGKTEATTIWRCAWEKEWLEAQGVDSARADAALAELDTWKTTPEYQATDDNGRTFFAEDLQKARLGDPSGFRETYPVQC